jgi:hypothetical protein
VARAGVKITRPRNHKPWQPAITGALVRALPVGRSVIGTAQPRTATLVKALPVGRSIAGIGPPGAFLALNSPSTVVYNNPEPSPYALPAIWMDTRYDPGGVPLSWTADILMVDQGKTTNTTNLQNEITAAAARNGHTRLRLPNNFVCGKIVLLDHTAGNFWTYIEWVNKNAVAAEGTQAHSATWIANLTNGPFIETLLGGSEYPIKCRPGADNYRFTGVTVWKPNNSGTSVTYLFYGWAVDPNPPTPQQEDLQTTLAACPHHIYFDRCVFRGPGGTAQLGVRLGLGFHGLYMAAVNCVFKDIWEAGGESKAIGMWGGPGPYKIVGNDMDGPGSLGILLGGADPNPALVVEQGDITPSDIEIRRNRIYRPPSWNKYNTVAAGLPDGGTAYDGISRNIKAPIDSKGARRMLIEGNFLSGVWTDGQSGAALLFKCEASSFPVSEPFLTSHSVTARYNWCERAGTFLSVSAYASGVHGNSQPWGTYDHAIYDNVCCEWGSSTFTLLPTRQIEVYGTKTKNITIDHNTVITLRTSPNINDWVLSDGTVKGPNVVITNNIGHRGAFGFFGSNGEGNGTWNAEYTSPKTMTKNAVIGINPGTYPAGNFGPATLSVILFTDAANKDFTLQAGSPYKNQSTDGRDVGANIAKVLTAISGGVRY